MLGGGNIEVKRYISVPTYRHGPKRRDEDVDVDDDNDNDDDHCSRPIQIIIERPKRVKEKRTTDTATINTYTHTQIVAIKCTLSSLCALRGFLFLLWWPLSWLIAWLYVWMFACECQSESERVRRAMHHQPRDTLIYVLKIQNHIKIMKKTLKKRRKKTETADWARDAYKISYVHKF